MSRRDGITTERLIELADLAEERRLSQGEALLLRTGITSLEEARRSAHGQQEALTLARATAKQLRGRVSALQALAVQLDTEDAWGASSPEIADRISTILNGPLTSDDTPAAPTVDDLNAAYRERAHLVAELAAHHPAVITPAADIDEPGWWIVYMIASGWQWSWHIHPRDMSLFKDVEVVPANDPRARWDGHTTEVKYQRIRSHAAELNGRTVGCCVCGSKAVSYLNYREQPFCLECSECGCGQDVCIRMGLHIPATRTNCGPDCAKGHMYDGYCTENPHLEGVTTPGHELPHRTGAAWSCAEDDGCGHLSLGHSSEAAARRGYDRHRARECPRTDAPQPEPTPNPLRDLVQGVAEQLAAEDPEGFYGSANPKPLDPPQEA